MSGIACEKLPVMWRTKLRSAKPGVNHEEQVNYCLRQGLVGIGWGVDDLPSGASLEKVLAKIEEIGPSEGYGPRAANTVRRFAQEAEVGHFVWARDTHGKYLLGQIRGAYRYDASEAAARVDTHQIRAAEWAKPLGELNVPGSVVRGFVGTADSFSRLHDEGGRRVTAVLWEQLHGRDVRPLKVSAREVMRSCLDPDDVEDLVCIWLQAARDYLVFLPPRQRGTPAYEWMMVHRKTGKHAIVQVKTGSTPVDISALESATTDRDVETFAFATCEEYLGGDAGRTARISMDELLRFVREHSELLPGRVATWFDRADWD